MLRLTQYLNMLLSVCTIVLGDQMMTCSSNNYAYTTCALTRSYDTIVKRKQLSGSHCTVDVSYGLSGDFIWVKGGCRATFFVTNTEKTTTTTAATTTTTTTATTIPITTALVVQTTNAITTTALTTPSTTTTTTSTTTAVVGTITSETTTAVLTVHTTTTDPTITTLLPNTTLLGGLCKCNCTSTTSAQNIDSVIQELRKTLTVNKSILSSTIRKKTSASDPRMSAAVIGYSGVIFLAVVAMVVVLVDFITLSRFISRKCQPAFHKVTSL